MLKVKGDGLQDFSVSPSLFQFWILLRLGSFGTKDLGTGLDKFKINDSWFNTCVR